MVDKSNEYHWAAQIGRFGYSLLSKLWQIKQFNPFTAFFIAFCLIWFFTISWCYIFAIFSRDTGRNNKLIPFALVFMTGPVWANQFYFLMQVVENTFIISLCPYVIYLLYKGFLDDETGKVICGTILLVLIISVYQAVVPLFCCGVFACFVLLQGQTDYKPQVYRNLVINLLITLISALAIYFFITRIILPHAFKIQQHSYIDSMVKWRQRPIGESIMNLFFFMYYLTIGHIPFVSNIFEPVIQNHVKIPLYDSKTMSVYMGNVLLLPAAIFFLISIIMVIKKNIPSGRRLLYALAGIGIILSPMLMDIAMGGAQFIRTHYALPLAFAFMLFFSIKTYRKEAAIVVACLSLLMAGYQAQITAQLFYSDQMRYNEDVRLAYELNERINELQPAGNRKLPVALIGRYSASSRFKTNFLEGENMGFSSFGNGFHYQRTRRALAFMRSLGIDYRDPSSKQLEDALKEAADMPPYPEPGCVKLADGFIVIRLSKSLN
jgi:hypothetical protein